MVDHAAIPHMKAICVPFHMGYGSLICSKMLQSDRPKCGKMLLDPRAFQNNAEIRLFVPGLNYTYVLENLKNFVSQESS